MPIENENEKELTPPAPEKEEKKEASVEEFIEIAKKQKENTVDKSAYDKVVAERNQLMQSILEGKDLPLQKQAEKADIAKLKERMRDPDISNLEFVKTSLQLRQLAIDNGEEDPYIPKGADKVSEADRQRVKEVADTLQKCVDEAEGSDTIFRGLLEEVIKKDDPMIAKRLRERGYIK